MKNIILLLFLFIPVFLLAQYPYPATGNKQRLGHQTTGDGLVFRGSGAPAYTPSSRVDPYVFLDTVANRYYHYSSGAWRDLSDEKYIHFQDANFLASPVKDSLTTYDRLFVAMEITSGGASDRGVQLPVTALDTSYAGRVVRISAIDSSGTYDVFVSSSSPDGLLIDGALATTYYLAAEETAEFQLYVFNDTYQWRLIHTNEIEPLPADNVTGSGTSGTLTKWTGTNTIGDAAITENATRLSASLPFRLANIATVSLPGVPLTGDQLFNTTTGHEWVYGTSSWLQGTFPTGTSGQTLRYDGSSWVAYTSLLSTGYLPATSDHNLSDRSYLQTIYGSTNGPVVSNNYTSLHIPGNSGRSWQIAGRNNSSGDLFVRYYETGWSSWFKVMTTNNDGAGSGFDADLVHGVAGNLLMNRTTLDANWNVSNINQFRLIASATNSPETGLVTYYGAHFPSSTTLGFQIAGRNGRQFFRTVTSSVYTPWYRQTTGYPVEGNIPFWGANANSGGDTLKNNTNLYWDNATNTLEVSNLEVSTLTGSPETIAGWTSTNKATKVTYETLIDSLITNGLSSYTGFTPASDSGSGSNVASGGTLTLTGGYGINSSVSGTTVTIESDTGQLATQYDLTQLTDLNGIYTTGAPDTVRKDGAILPITEDFYIGSGTANYDETDYGLNILKNSQGEISLVYPGSSVNEWTGLRLYNGSWYFDALGSLGRFSSAQISSGYREVLGVYGVRRHNALENISMLVSSQGATSTDTSNYYILRFNYGNPAGNAGLSYGQFMGRNSRPSATSGVGRGNVGEDRWVISQNNDLNSFDWLRVDFTGATDFTSNNVSFYNGAYSIPNETPVSTNNVKSVIIHEGNGTNTTPTFFIPTLFTQTAIDTVNNTASETSLINTGVGTTTIPADYLEPGRTIVCEGAGWWSNNSVTPSLQFRQKIGAVTVGATGAGSMPNLAGGQEFWEYKVTMTCQTDGASGTVMTQGAWTWQYGDFTDGRKLSFSNTTTATVNTTISNALDFTVQMGSADANAYVVMTNFVCEAKN